MKADNRTIGQSDNQASRKGAEAQSIKAWFTMVLDPWTGKWRRVGRAYFSKETARGWVSFVRAAWRGCPTKVVSCTLRFRDGLMTPNSIEVLDKKFNMEPPSDLPVILKLGASAPLREESP